ncbi:NAD(P)/FAD-dependent oxidoreductase [Hyphococcus sp.]|uniref:NAD(P)/FAD-dependent oxidoreductase n=1 Tax=Hyphococcus sp. TaxID=2038636 RepID=UPI003D10A4B8
MKFNDNLVLKTACIGPQRPRIGIIGAGIAGLGAAWGLYRDCDVTVFEKNAYIGGHTNTVTFDAPEGPVAVDTGFIVYNEPNYPNLTALFKLLDVRNRATEMHFSVSARERDIEYASSGLSGLFADLKNITRPRFFAMIADILRFYASAPKLADSSDDVTLGQFLHAKKYSATFIQDHILPMAAAIWSCPVNAILEFPVKSLARFFINHGLVELGSPFEWRSILGGSASYIPKLTAGFSDRIFLNTPVASVRRTATGILLQTRDGQSHLFDHIIFACHAPQAARLLDDRSDRETSILSNFKTQPNRAVLHTDERLMPRRRRAWASWNYLSHREGEHALAVTYWMNELQKLDTKTNCFVTLNPFEDPRADSVIAEFSYDHPVFDSAATKAQRAIWEIQGRGGVWYAGAWLGYGFHEDGLQAGLAIAESISAWRRPWEFDFSRERLSRQENAVWRVKAAA